MSLKYNLRMTALWKTIQSLVKLKTFDIFENIFVNVLLVFLSITNCGLFLMLTFVDKQTRNAIVLFT